MPLLAADRRRLGLPPLVADAELATIARAHSQDMASAGFFGHRSPTTGLVADRLIKAGYRASAHAENLAENETLVGAEQSLMGSVGHRRNIASKVFTHVGIGIARRKRGDDHSWIVTQVFARKVKEIDSATATTALLERINKARRDAGRSELRLRADLSSPAADGAARVAAGELTGISRAVLDRVQDLVDREASVSTHVIYDLAQLEVSAGALDARWSEVGIGVVQAARDPHGRTGVVLVFAR